MTDPLPRCLKCRLSILVIRGALDLDRPLCSYCSARLTSLNSHVALAQGKALTLGQREWLFKWFLETKYFAFHRRMSRGRAKKLLLLYWMHEAAKDIKGAESINPANVSPRGPHDPVTDSAPPSS